MLKAWKEQGVDPPEDFVKRAAATKPEPELTFVDVQYLMVFYEVTTCRNIVNGAYLPVPLTAVDVAARRFGFDGAEFYTLLHVVRELDRLVIEAHAKEMSKHDAGL